MKKVRKKRTKCDFIKYLFTKNDVKHNSELEVESEGRRRM